MEVVVRYRDLNNKEVLTPIFKNLLDTVFELLISKFVDKDELMQQYASLEISEIFFSGVGFYCYFIPTINSVPLSQLHCTFGDVIGTINSESVGFHLCFYKTDYIGAIECYKTYFEDDEGTMLWNCINEIKEFEVKKIEREICDARWFNPT